MKPVQICTGFILLLWPKIILSDAIDMIDTEYFVLNSISLDQSLSYVFNIINLESESKS